MITYTLANIDGFLVMIKEKTYCDDMIYTLKFCYTTFFFVFFFAITCISKLWNYNENKLCSYAVININL